ncbi:MAG: YafY family transcriptional regulator [Clostridiales bacterium]|nr:YafY family transcriptional regulator [Clostridiales bacterium]
MNRLFEITYILLNRTTVTAKELAGHFGVSTRTIYRDIDVLSLAGVPVYTEKGKGGGIGLLPDFVLDKSILSEQEQDDILSALQSLSGVRATENGQVLEKLSAVFNKNAVRWLEVDFSDWGAISDKAFGDFKTAILERRIAEFDYYSTYGEMTRRRIEPVQLWFKSKAWYVKGFCLTRQDIRLFKLSRVRNLAVTDERFAVREYPADLPDPSPDCLEKKAVALKLKVAPEMAYRVYDEFIEETAEKQPDGSFVVSVTWPEDDWVYRLILSYGEYIEVLEPEHARETIKGMGKKIAEKY